MPQTKSQHSSTLSKLYKSRKIILSLAQKRGYNIEDYDNFTINELNVLWVNNQMDILLENEKEDKKLYIKYHIMNKISPKNIYEYIDDLYRIEEILDEEKDDLIIVIKDKCSDSLLALISAIYNKDKIFFNVYNYNNYLFNILEHERVPKHTLLTDSQKEAISKKYNILKDSEYPEISRFDPVAMAIGLRPGQLCEIERSSPTSLTTKYYRICV
jgi:DNA-directed RNA polymerase subunit H (RpoH/RPB5)